jgi:kumamolisin
MTHRVKQPPNATISKRRPSPKEVVAAVFLVRHLLSHKKASNALAEMAGLLPARREYMNPAEAARAFSANPDDVNLVAGYLNKIGFKVIGANAEAAHVVVEGQIAHFEKAFGIQFVYYDHPRGEYRSYKGRVRLPHDLQRLVTGVIGLDNRSMARPHMHAPVTPGKPKVRATKVAGIYHYPKSTAAGQCIAIVSLGGGIYRSDIKRYFDELGLPQPKIDVILSDGVKNRPAKRSDVKKYLAAFRESVETGQPPNISFPPDVQEQIEWTIENTMDLQLAATFAPGARIALYLGENTEAGKVHALANAIRDWKRTPSIISCSWGADETDCTTQYFDAMATLFVQAGLLGITLCVSTGDDGSPPSTPVNYPSCSPWVLACGGTKLSRSGVDERVWFETFGPLVLGSTGGFSSIFPLPAWQKAATASDRAGHKHAGRAVPDVSAKADLVGGYSVLIAGVEIAMGGTSAVPPAWAGLIARINRHTATRTGYLTELLYGSRFRHTERDIVQGHTQSFRSRKGWDACTGWGSPDGELLLKALNP